MNWKKVKVMGVLLIPGGLVIVLTGILLGLKHEEPVPLQARIMISCIGGFNVFLGTLFLLVYRKSGRE